MVKHSIPDDIKENIEKLKNIQNKKSTHPRTMDELKELLISDGQQWREEHKEKQKHRDGTISYKIHHPSPREVADILERHLIFGLIAASDDEMEKARISFYDFDAGIYKSSERTLKQLATYVERNLSIRQQKEVINFLFLDSPRLTEIKDKDLIVLGNGIFNRKEHKLLDFSLIMYLLKRLLLITILRSRNQFSMGGLFQSGSMSTPI